MVLSCIFELKPLFLIHSKDLIKEYLDSFFINKLSDETVKSKLPAYQPVTTFARGKFINEGEISALTVEMKVNNCRDRLSQGRDRSRFCPFCPGLMASEFNVAWICPRLSTLRRDIGINSFKNQVNCYQEEKDTYFAYINGLDSSNQCISCFLLQSSSLGQSTAPG